ncbi:MAG: M48 family peptidase [Microbacteriaceae bacterium]|nr:M48 family peptidase [Microbacteriaceae bacterium]
MSAELIRNLLIFITLGIAVFRVVLNELDIRSSAKALGDETVAKAVAYVRTKHRFESSTIGFQALLTSSFLLLGWFGEIQRVTAGWVSGAIWQDLLFLLTIGLGLYLIGIPASIYSTFVIEAKYGFNRTTAATFITDRIKGLVIGALIGVPIILLLLWIYQVIPTQLWWIAFLILTGVQFILFAIGTTVLLPLFNKLQELPAGELRDKIEQLCKELNYKVKRIFVMDASKRSSKTNAFFSGIGKTKTIVLFDSMIEKHTVDEVVGVLGHEIGHDRLGHVRSGFINATVQTFLIFALFGWALQEPALTQALGGEGTKLVLSLIAFGMLFSPLNFVLSVIQNVISRRNEHASDIFASKVYGPKPIISALSRLQRDNLSNPNPHPLFVAVYYSHPPVEQRVAHVERLAKA